MASNIILKYNEKLIIQGNELTRINIDCEKMQLQKAELSKKALNLITELEIELKTYKYDKE